jgi:hypothetical protein
MDNSEKGVKSIQAKPKPDVINNTMQPVKRRRAVNRRVILLFTLLLLGIFVFYLAVFAIGSYIGKPYGATGIPPIP